MCHHLPVMLSAEDKAAAKKMTGFMIPVYAAVLLALFAVVSITVPRSHERIASASAAVPQR
jgi:hypothetical protein